MNKCLVTKLNGSCNNTNLLRIGEMRVHFAKVDSPTASTQGKTFSFAKDAELEIIGDAYFTDVNLSANLGKKITIPAMDEQGFFVSNANCDVAILNKYALRKLLTWKRSVPAYGKNISLNIDNLNYSNTLTVVSLSDAQATGDIANLKSLTALTILNLYNTQVTGDIANLKNLTALTSLNLYNAQVTGDIANLKSLTALTTISMSNTSISGDIANLKSLTALTTISMSNTSVSGDIANLKSLTALTGLDLSSTQITGDIAQLKSCPNIGELRVPNSVVGDLAKLPAKCYFVSLKGDNTATYTWTSRSSSSNIFAIEGNIAVTNIDKMLQDLAQCQAAIPSSGQAWFKKISVAGNRTSASDAAVAKLQEKGYTISIAKA